MNEHWTTARAFAGEGARCGITTCRKCGAAVLLDPHDTTDPMTTHENWHAAIAQETT